MHKIIQITINIMLLHDEVKKIKMYHVGYYYGFIQTYANNQFKKSKICLRNSF
jgi:hypothetical protein